MCTLLLQRACCKQLVEQPPPGPENTEEIHLSVYFRCLAQLHPRNEGPTKVHVAFSHAPTLSICSSYHHPAMSHLLLRVAATEEAVHTLGPGDSTPVTPSQAHQPSSKKRRRVVTSQAGRACDHCGRLKMKCIVPPGGSSCERCNAAGKTCVWKPSNRGKWNRKAKDRGKQTHSLVQDVDEPTARDDSESSIYPDEEEDDERNDEQQSGLPHFETPAEEPHDYGGAIHFKVDNSLFPVGLLAESSLNMTAMKTSRTVHDSVPRSSRTGPANPGYFGQGLNRRMSRVIGSY